MAPSKLTRMKQRCNKDKRLKMLLRRMASLTQANENMKITNEQLVNKVVETDLLLSNLKNENHTVMKQNFNLLTENNKLKNVLQKLNHNLTKLITWHGDASHILLNSKTMLTNQNLNLSIFEDYSSAGSTCNFLNTAECDKTKSKAQAMVNPMIEGQIIKSPMVSLKRLKFNSQELHEEKKGLRELTRHFDTEKLSPISEAVPSTSRRLGWRHGPRFNDVAQQREREIQMAVEYGLQGIPMVRLHDVSTLLNNSSLLILNQNENDNDVNNSESLNRQKSVEVENRSIETPVDGDNDCFVVVPTRQEEDRSRSLDSNKSSSSSSFTLDYSSSRITKFRRRITPVFDELNTSGKRNRKKKTSRRECCTRNPSQMSLTDQDNESSLSTRSSSRQKKAINYKEEKLNSKKRRE
ncbi:uncharacterized protein LOC106660875 isoform X2 [Cimex lectularius]|uniref:Uncharacterized protein n=1 Tax=Cimex lectularius TaxID=79782 RepID=A0A8I6R8S2_CIMLE|nr:uncharacterized protein LOC106660875 isoform X2 [Cimex lectularius]